MAAAFREPLAEDPVSEVAFLAPVVEPAAVVARFTSPTFVSSPPAAHPSGFGINKGFLASLHRWLARSEGPFPPSW